MNARLPEQTTDWAARASAIDWPAVTDTLNTEGAAILPALLDPSECEALAGLYTEQGISAAAW